MTNNNHNHKRSHSTSFDQSTEIIVKTKSVETFDSSRKKFKSRSLEVISNLALWSTSLINIELYKSDHGLGFSVLDYQDPSKPTHSPVIVIRSLVPGGVAQLDGRIVPGDRLVAVNNIILENMTLDNVINILKATPKGIVKLSLSKPLPYPKFNDEKIISNNDQCSSRMNKSKLSNNKYQVYFFFYIDLFTFKTILLR